VRDPSHIKHIDTWATFVREHPLEWKKIHTEFINAQYQKATEFMKRLEQEPGGKEKVRKMLELRRQNRVR